MAKTKSDVIRVPHPSNDGTWVEFHGMSYRQEEVLNELIKKSKTPKKK